MAVSFGTTDRPIDTTFNVYWSAWFKDEYDGAPDSRSLIGHGRTEAEAVANLLEVEADAKDSAGD